MNFRGHDSKGYEPKIQKTIVDCQRSCKVNEICVFWSYSKKTKKCYFKNGQSYKSETMNYDYDSADWNCDLFFATEKSD